MLHWEFWCDCAVLCTYRAIVHFPFTFVWGGGGRFYVHHFFFVLPLQPIQPSLLPASHLPASRLRRGEPCGDYLQYIAHFFHLTVCTCMQFIYIILSWTVVCQCLVILFCQSTIFDSKKCSNIGHRCNEKCKLFSF